MTISARTCGSFSMMKSTLGSCVAKASTRTSTLTAGEKFEETELPSKEAFYSKLSMKGISDADYEHAKKVWSSMKKKRT